MKIRRFDPNDAAQVSDVLFRSVSKIGPRDYSQARVQAWASRVPDSERIRSLCADGRTVFVVVDNADMPVAFGDLEADGHIDYLYCAPEFAGTDVASALYDFLETMAIERGIACIYSEASEAARRFFVRKGFTVKTKREFEIAGVQIHNYAVEKIL